MMNLEDPTPIATPQFAASSNELNDPPMAPNLTQYVHNRVWQHMWNWQQLQSSAKEVNKSL